MFYIRMIIGIVTATLLTFGDPAAASDPSDQFYTDGEVLVKYKEHRATQKADHYQATWSMSNARTFGKSGVRKIKLPADMSVDQAVALYRSDPDVLYAEPNYRYRLQALPNDPHYDRLWGLDNYGQQVNGTHGTRYADVDAKRAWDLETGSRTIVVAVIDSGVALDHPDLEANLWTNSDEIPGNNLDDDGNGYVDDIHGWDFAANDNAPFDSEGHGTHVAGIIGAVGNNNQGVTGVCWQVSIMPLRFIAATQYGTTADAIEAIEYADKMGADVINLSWGGTHYSQALKEAIGAADAIVVCAAGNEGYNLDVTPLYPASYDSANILSVAATDADDYPAWFTNYSTNRVDVAAPGNNILSTIPYRTTLFTENFADTDHWTFGGTDNRWGLENASDGRKVLTESADGRDYGTNVDTWAKITDPLNLTGRSGLRMDFQITGIGSDSNDRLTVEASSNQIEWTQLRIGLEDDGATGTISGSLPAWQWAAVDLGAFDDNAVVYLRFRFVSDAYGTADGYSIANLTISCADSAEKSDAYQYYRGTSMSAAYASGVAALVLARKPTLTVAEVRLVMETSVDRKPQLADYVASAGRINAYNALESVANIILQTQALASDQINLDWASHQENASGFEILRRIGSAGEFETVAIAGPYEGGYTDSGLSADTTYVYRVLTLNGETRTGYSNEASATTLSTTATDQQTSGSGGCFITSLIGGAGGLSVVLTD